MNLQWPVSCQGLVGNRGEVFLMNALSAVMVIAAVWSLVG